MSVAVLGRRAVAAYAQLLVRYRLPILVLSIVVAIGCGYGARWLTFNPDSRVFFGADNPERLALEALENTYTRASNVVFVLAPDGGDVFTRETLTAVDWLADRAQLAPYSTRVYSLTGEQHSHARGDEVIVEPLVADPAALTASDIEALRQTVLDRADLVGWLVSAAADVTAVTVLVDPPRRSRSEVPEVAAFARQLAVELTTRFPDLRVYLSGGVIGDAAFAEAGRRDLLTLMPVMVALIVATLALGLRSVPATVATMLVIALSLVTTMGLAGWIGMVLNPATAGAPVTIMTLSLATCVHIVTTTGRELAAGLDRHGAVVAAMQENATPVAINSLTTVVGFLALGFSVAPPLAELGNLVAFGSLVALAFSFTFLPAALAMFPPPTSPEAGLLTLRAWLRRLADFVIQRARLVLAIGAVTLVVLGLGMTRLSFDDDFIRYFDDSYAFRRDTDFLQQRLNGLNVVQYSVPSGRDQGVTDPDYLHRIEAFTDWLRQQDKVSHVSSITDIFKRLNMNMNADDPAFYRTPDRQDLAAQYLLFYEMSLPFGHDLNAQIDIARSSSKVTAFIANASSDEIRSLGLRGEAWLREQAPGMAAPPTGLSMMYAYLSQRNVQSMLAGTAVGLVVISAMLIAALGSVRLGLLSLIPNFFPAFMAFGVWGYFAGEVNLAVSVVAVTTFGIVVDDTVHLLASYLHARRKLGMENADAIRYCFDTSGVACLITTVALGLGFVVLSMSGFAVTQQMGMLSAITILIAWFGDYFCLPPLLMLLGRKLK